MGFDPGPSLRAAPFDAIGDGAIVRLLTTRQRRDLLALSTRITIGPRGTLYREHAAASAVYICSAGALKAFRDFPSGRRRVTAFLFPDDLFGLSEHGRYLNTVQALTPTVCHRIPLNRLREKLLQDAELEFYFLCKVVHELRELQFRSIIMGHRSARGRVVLFLKMLEKNLAGHAPPGTIQLPMSRSDIADFLGLSLEAVSRAGRRLVDAGVVAWQGARSLRVVDRKELERIAADL